MKTLSDRVAVVTGAGSGIGRALSGALAARGCRLAISDIDEAAVTAVAEQLRAGGAEVLGERLDVADREAVHAHAERVHGHYGAVHLVINNAGVSVGATVENISYEDFEWLMGINFWGVVHGTKAFLPFLKQAEEGHIVNISSVFGLIGMPAQCSYNAAKFAVRGFTECLRMELEIDGSRVSCTSVHPGGIKTNIARAARVDEDALRLSGGDKEQMARRFEKMARTTPEQAAEVIVKGILQDRRRVLIGGDARFIDRMQRLLPTAYQRLIVKGQARLAGRPRG